MDTSGLLIIAKNDKAHIQVSKQIKNREVKKTYIALVRGTIAEDEATINMPIGRSTKDRKKMAVTKNGKEAVTHFTSIVWIFFNVRNSTYGTKQNKNKTYGGRWSKRS